VTTTATPPQKSALGSKDRNKTAIAAAFGTSVENYDFIAYGTASALYFGAVFFPESDRFVGTLLSFATLAVGFLMRPLGGAVGGYLADRFGRKPVLVGAMIVMGAATFLIGLLPTYAQIGVVAPILLVVIRMIQGLAFGAEWGGAITMAYEHAPWNRRGMYAAIPQAGNPVGIALASAMFLVCANLEGDWRWRIPFLLSAVLVIVALIVRSRLSESPEFMDAKAEGKIEKNPFLTTIRRDWRSILRVIGLRIVESFAYYSTATYLLNYLTERFPDIRPTALGAITAASIVAVFVTFLAGSLTDRVGRRPSTSGRASPRSCSRSRCTCLRTTAPRPSSSRSSSSASASSTPPSRATRARSSPSSSAPPPAPRAPRSATRSRQPSAASRRCSPPRSWDGSAGPERRCST
jgi:MFS family permease